MDCSTFSNRTGVDDTTVGEESAVALRRQLEASVRILETTQQELHEARRNYQTALDVQHHLTAELEAQRAGEERKLCDLRVKISSLQDEVQNLRSERSSEIDLHTQKTEALESKIRDLQERLSFKDIEQQITEDKTHNGSLEDLNTLKNEHNGLLSSLSEHKRLLEDNVTVIASLKDRLSELGEELSCSRSILESKKEELQSATDALHSAQSELCLANLELQRLKSDGSEHATKGNSLFAEVEDKRQEMAKTLIQMKHQNVQLKRELSNKQAELESLLCEKRTLWEEYAGLAGALDAEMIKSYEQRITELTRTVEQQRRERARWFSKYYEPGGTQAAEWLAGVLAHLKNRCSQLTDDLLESSVDNLSKAAQIRELQKKVAALRLKAFETGSAQPESVIHMSDNEENTKEFKINVKTEAQNILEETNTGIKRETNGIDKRNALKKEKSINDVKKKVTF